LDRSRAYEDSAESFVPGLAMDLSISEHEGEWNGQAKIINDPVHGHISVPHYCLEFIGTFFAKKGAKILPLHFLPLL
jgi:hypothetical protein